LSIVSSSTAASIRWLCEGLEEDLQFARWLDTQTAPFPGEPDRRCDTVAEFVSRSGTQPPWACVVEPQAQQQADFVVRLFRYLLALYEELRHGPHDQDRYLMVGAIVNLSEGTLQKALNWVPPGHTGGVGLTGKVWARDVCLADAAGVLAEVATGQVARCVLPWIPLMQGGERADIIEEWKRLAELETNPATRNNYKGLALVFADQRKRREIWQQALEGWNVYESTIVNEWREEGRQEGREEGRQEGLHALQQSLLGELRTRFPEETLPPEVQTTLEQQTSFEELARWMVFAATTPSLEEFRRSILGSNGAQ
jgi:hypothetical protein